MSQKKGDMRIWVIGLIAAIIVMVVVLTGGFKTFDKFYFLTDLLGINGTVDTEGLSMVGINLENGKLNYYTGAKWKEVDKDKYSRFTLGDYNFGTAEMESAFDKFYYEDYPRKPEQLTIEANYWRYWNVLGFRQNKKGYISVNSKTKGGFEGGDFNALGYLRYDNVFPANDRNTEDANINTFTLEYEKDKNKELLQKVIAWRDQILEGQPCQAFINLNLRIEDGDSEVGTAPSGNAMETAKKYSVRKVDKYLFVDLEREAFGISLYEDCTPMENYDDSIVDRSGWKNDAGIRIEFSELIDVKSADSKMIWDPKEQKWMYTWKPGSSSLWFLYTGGYRELRPASEISGVLKMSSLEVNSLFNGLQFLFGQKKGFSGGAFYDKKIKVFIVDDKDQSLEGPLPIPLDSDGSVKLDLLTGDIYVILDAYNRQLKLSASSNLPIVTTNIASCDAVIPKNIEEKITQITFVTQYSSSAADPEAHGTSPFVALDPVNQEQTLEVVPRVRGGITEAVIASTGQVISGAYINPALNSKITELKNLKINSITNYPNPSNEKRPQYIEWENECKNYCNSYVSEASKAQCTSNSLDTTSTHLNTFEDVLCTINQLSAGSLYTCNVPTTIDFWCSCAESDNAVEGAQP